MNDKQKREALADTLAWKVKAQQKEWKQPLWNDPFGIEAWVRYWKACDAYEKDPSSGRPIPPHR
jgi:hypothetical protein